MAVAAAGASGSNGELYSIAADAIQEEESTPQGSANSVNGNLRSRQSHQQAQPPPTQPAVRGHRRSHHHPQKHLQHQQTKQEQAKWIAADARNGFVRVYSRDAPRLTVADLAKNSSVVACTTETTAARLCQQLSLPSNALHIETPDGRLRRLDPFECPLALQNAVLTELGYTDAKRVQKLGPAIDIGFCVARFYAGRPVGCRTFARHNLQGLLEVRTGGAALLAKWEKRLCECGPTAVTVYKGTDKLGGDQTSVLLARGSVQALKSAKHGREHCLQIRGIGRSGEKELLLAFKDEVVMERWRKHIEKSTSQHDQTADLSESQLETVPEQLFALTQLRSLNLKRNCLFTKTMAESHQVRVKLGYLDDLHRFRHLTVLNLSANLLTEMPASLCFLKSLVELNIATNQIAAIPTEISGLTKLEILHAHNNRLASLPDSMSALTHLSMLVLAFNHFLEVPPVLATMSRWCENIVMPGNRISSISERLADRLKPIRRINFRMNQISMNGTNSMRLDRFQQLAYLDLRDNLIETLDLQDLPLLEFFCGERNRLTELRLNGRSLKSLLLEENRLSSLDIDPPPEHLEYLDASQNRLAQLPQFLGELKHLVHCRVSHNFLTELPPGLFIGSASGHQLKVLIANHNAIHSLPEELQDSGIEELQLQHNWLSRLPDTFFAGLARLRLLNLTRNRLTSLPRPEGVSAPADGFSSSGSKLQELNISFNHLDNSSLSVLAKFHRLRVLRLAFNQITELNDEFVGSLKFLQELNLSGNQLRQLPQSLLLLERLTVLKAHSNMLQELPDFRQMSELRALDVGCNHLLTGSLRDLMEAKLSFLDLSGNDKMGLSMQDITAVRTKSRIKTVNSAGEAQSLSRPSPAAAAAAAAAPLRLGQQSAGSLPFNAGLAESTGSRSRMCISVMNQLAFPTPDSALFAVFDGGRNSTVPCLLQRNFAKAYWEQLKAGFGEQTALRYALLVAHRRLLGHGQRLGASGAVLCLKRRSADRWEATVANAGNAEVVLVQRERPMRLTRLFTAQRDRDEAERVAQAGGMVTEDGRVNGSCDCTRQLGGAYLHPCVVPEPQVTQVNLTDSDDSLILANRSFWAFVSYDEAADEVREAEHPVAAAKRLIDLAQAYGSTENISILVVKIRLSLHHQHRLAAPGASSLGRRHPPAALTPLPDADLEDPDYAELRLSLADDAELASTVSSQQSMESDSSEQWMRRRINGYQKLKSGRTVEEIERERREGSQQQQQRMFAKRHENTERLGTEMRLRLAGEVKRQELDSDLAEVVLNSPSDSDSERSSFTGGVADGEVASNWRRIGAGDAAPKQRQPGNWGDRRSTLMSHAHRSLTLASAGTSAAVDFDDEDPERLSEITNSELLLSPPRDDRIGDAGVDPDDEEQQLGDDDFSLAADGYESLTRYRPVMAAGGGLWRPDAGHEGMREETYMVERQGAAGGLPSKQVDASVGRLSENGDTYAHISRPTQAAKPPPPPPPPRELTDRGTEPSGPGAASPTGTLSPPATPSSTFSFTAATGGRKPRLNPSLSQQSSSQPHQYRTGTAAAAASAAAAAAAAYEDQELVMDIRSVATSYASVVTNSGVAECDEDTPL